MARYLNVLTPQNFNDIDDTSQACADFCRNPFNYVQGWMGPNFPVPAVVSCQWCGSTDNVCQFNGDGRWCPDFFYLFNKLANQDW